MRTKFLSILVFCFVCALNAQEKKFHGILVDDSNTPLPKAYIKDQNQKIIATTDDSGKFELANSNNIICFNNAGYYDTCIEVKSKENNITIKLRTKITRAKEVIIRKEKNALIKGIQTGVFIVKTDSFRSLPTLTGEADPFKLLQLSPGVAKSEVNMGINVRGSSTDQNLILFDNAIIFNPTHLLGFVSIFNPLVVDNINLIKSGIPVSYGNHFSSVTNIESNKNIPEKPEFKANIGILLSSTSVKVPLIQDKLSLTLAYRKSYIDYTVKPVTRLLFKDKLESFNSTQYGFDDINASIIYKPSPYDNMFISGYTGRDNFKLENGSFDINNTINWSNQTLSATWMRNRHSFHSMKTTMAYSKYTFDFYLGQTDLNYELNSKVDELSILHEHSFFTKYLNIKSGIQYISNTLNPNSYQTRINNISYITGSISDYYLNTYAGYVQTEVKLFERVSILLGLRGNYYSHTGPFKRIIPGNTGINDTITYTRESLIKSYVNWEPRLNAVYMIDSLSSIKLSATRNVQYLQQVNITAVTLPTDFWLPATAGIKPIEGYQLSLGYFKKISDSYEFSIDSYFKRMDNILEYNSSLLVSKEKTDVIESLLFGYGRAYGLEFLLEKKDGSLKGWLSYTLSRTERVFTEINNGKPFPAKYDHTHDVSLVLQKKINEKWSSSMVFIFSTGNALTLPIGRYMIQGNILNQYGEYQSFRMPVYHRMDVSFTRTFKKKGQLEQKLNLGLYNIYSRLNPYYVYFSVTGDLKKGDLNISPASVSLFPVLPSVSYEIRF